MSLQWTLVWGVGLAFGVPKSTVIRFFLPQPIEVRYYINKTYCAVRFASSKDSETAKQTKTGQEIVPTHPIYVAFLVSGTSFLSFSFFMFQEYALVIGAE